jgi:hypothetical protein
VSVAIVKARALLSHVPVRNPVGHLPCGPPAENDFAQLHKLWKTPDTVRQP